MLHPVPFVLMLLLTSCTTLTIARHVPLSTMSRLASLKLADIDPATLRVAARLPLVLEPRIGGVNLHIQLIMGSSALEREFILEPATGLDEIAHLTGYKRDGTRLWIYRLAKDDVDILRQIRKEDDGATGRRRVSISVGVAACHREALQSKPLLTTTFLRIDTAEYFTLTDDFDIRSIASDRDLATRVPRCP